MGGFTRPAWALGSVFPSVSDVGLVVALVLFNAVVFVVYFERWLGEELSSCSLLAASHDAASHNGPQQRASTSIRRQLACAPVALRVGS